MVSSGLTLYLAAALLTSVLSVNAQQGAWQQCGGNGWDGGTTCISGYTCTKLNDWYYQCLPGTDTPTSTSTSTSISTSGTDSTTSILSDPSSSTSSYISDPYPSTSTTTSSSAPPVVTGGQSTNPDDGKQIRTVSPPVYHLYIQLVDGKAMLGPEATSGYFVYGTTVGLVMADGSKLYLNVDMSPSTSYKPVSFGTVATTTNWSLSGDTFKVGGTQNWVVCPTSDSNYWDFYLQTGVDMPSSACTNWITIHLPCLC